MKTDLFSKIMLLSIAIFLGIIAMRPFFPAVHAEAQTSPAEEKLSYIKPMGVTQQFVVLLDTRNGNIWYYDLTLGTATLSGRLDEVGRPLVR